MSATKFSVPKSAHEACVSCRFFADGECRRYAPDEANEGWSGGSLHPQVEESHWCGEWSAARPTLDRSQIVIGVVTGLAALSVVAACLSVTYLAWFR